MIKIMEKRKRKEKKGKKEFSMTNFRNTSVRPGFHYSSVPAQSGEAILIASPALMDGQYLYLKYSAFKDLTPYALLFAPVSPLPFIFSFSSFFSSRCLLVFYIFIYFLHF
jgi:hypothetical protein